MSPPYIFNKTLLKKRRNNIAHKLAGYDFLLQRSCQDIVEKLRDWHRHDFATALELGSRFSYLKTELTNSKNIDYYLSSNLAINMITAPGLVCDNELLPFAASSFDLIISPLDLHYANDLPGALAQIRQCLKPDGIFIASCFGGKTLTELRQVLLNAELSTDKGVSPHISPFIDSIDASALMQRAGFAMPVVDVDKITATYQNITHLMHDLRYMGENNMLASRGSCYLGKKVINAAQRKYKDEFSEQDGSLKASFEIITMTGMK